MRIIFHAKRGVAPHGFFTHTYTYCNLGFDANWACGAGCAPGGYSAVGDTARLAVSRGGDLLFIAKKRDSHSGEERKSKIDWSAHEPTALIGVSSVPTVS